MGDLGPCMGEYCDRPGVLLAAGPTGGRSPRVTFIAGERAEAAADGEHVLSVRCMDCAVGVVLSLPVPINEESTDEA